MSLTDLLKILLNADVKFVLAGGLAAVTQGAPVTTFDADIVHERSEANVDRLLAVLATLHTYVREPTNRRLPPSRAGLLGAGHNLFVTDCGPLDCLGSIEDGLNYTSLQPMCIDLMFHGRTLQVVKLQTLADLKGRWKDDESQLRAALLRKALNRA
jgi:hypothetical protein